MTRLLQPELLDTLPSDNPEAARSRTDLRRVNWWMSHRPILQRALEAAPLKNVRRIVELGAGDGTLALQLARQLRARWPNVDLTLVDRQPVVTAETLEIFHDLGWNAHAVKADVFAWLANKSTSADVIFVNLFLHHFDETGLRQIFQTIAARCSYFVALEPSRTRIASLGCELLWMIGCNRVTRHDARISVQAGFRGGELSALWPDVRNWTTSETSAGLFSHLFIASRKSA